MVTKYGFSEKIGPVVYGGNDQDEVFLGRDFNSPPSYSDEVASKIDSEVRNIVENAYAKTAEILHAHEDQMHLLAKYLLRNEKIERDDFKHLMEGTMDKETIAECMKEDTDFYAFPVSTDAETEEQ